MKKKCLRKRRKKSFYTKTKKKETHKNPVIIKVIDYNEIIFLGVTIIIVVS